MRDSHPMHRIAIFTDRYPLIGPALWVVSLQYFIVQLVVGAAWSTHFSLTNNTISDLGNTACGAYGGRVVCSPLHALMNVSFIVLGITMLSGVGLIYHEFKRSNSSRIGFGAMGLSAIGTILVGVFPENTISGLHFLGAMLTFLIGNIGMIILGASLNIGRRMSLYSVISGLFALVTLGFFVSKHYLGLGDGGMERLAAYPQTVWLISFGVYMSCSHFKQSKRANTLR